MRDVCEVFLGTLLENEAFEQLKKRYIADSPTDQVAEKIKGKDEFLSYFEVFTIEEEIPTKFKFIAKDFETKLETSRSVSSKTKTSLKRKRDEEEPKVSRVSSSSFILEEALEKVLLDLDFVEEDKECIKKEHIKL